jgi:hexosaminidase
MFIKIIVLFVLVSSFGFSQTQLPLIPYPKEIEKGNKSFILNSKTVINAHKDSFEALYLKQIIKLASWLRTSILAR